MKLVFTVLFGLACSFNSLAQNPYKMALGVRYFYGPDLSAKFSLKGNTAAEALLGGFRNGLKGTLLYQWHNPALGGNAWRWYYGFGGHMGASPERRFFRRGPYAAGRFQVGVDGILGIEHSFRELPLNISADWKPEFNLLHNTGLDIPIFGFSARFYLK